MPSAIELGYNRNSCLDFCLVHSSLNFQRWLTTASFVVNHYLSVGESCQIGSKGLASLMKVSQLLHDGLESQFSSKHELVLHTNCRKKYTRPSNIKAATKSSDKHDAPVPTNSRTRCSLDKVFDFETDCLFYGKDATVGIKLELKYWKTVSNCETLDLQGSVRSQCLKRMRSGVGLC